MSESEIIKEIENEGHAFVAKVEGVFEPAEAIVVSDAKAIGSATLNYIQANGLQDAYQIALIVVGAMAPGASWATALASIESQAIAAGKTLASGASAIVAGMAQTDLIAAGKLLPPTASAA